MSTPWGPLGYITFKRTYARRLNESDPNSATEEYPDTVKRIIKATKTQLKCGFTDEEEAELEQILLNLKGSVAGRFLWQLGTKTVSKLGLLSLQNCAFTTVDSTRAFTWAMDALMLGSGVGFNIQKEYVYQLPKVRKAKIVRQDVNDADFIVPDSREGWVKLLEETLKAHFETGKGFTYSTVLIRGKGAPIKGFGGKASGPEELCQGIADISQLLNDRHGKKIRPIDALDIMNIIGSIVVAGNIRRSAEISIGDADDLQYLSSKRWDLGNIPNHRAMSNNSVVCNDINKLPEQFWDGYNGNGEPFGLINLSLSRKVGRLGETQYLDPDTCGYNPCFSSDTLILTDKGLFPINTLVGKAVKVRSNNQWVEIDNFRITGRNQKMLKITMQDGSVLRVTPYHSMILKDGSRVEAKSLKIGQKLKISTSIINGSATTKGAYIKGFLCGDGSLSKEDTPKLYLYRPKFICKDRLIQSANEIENGPLRTNVITEMKFTDQISKGKLRQIMTGLTPKKHELALWCSEYKKRLPIEAFSWDLKTKSDFLAGLFDADGTASDTKNGFLYQLSSVEKEFLIDVQSLLKTIGVYSKLSQMKKAGVFNFNDGYGDFLQKDSWRLTISQASSITLSNQAVFSRLISFKDKATAYAVSPKRDTIVGINEDGVDSLVYCCTVPETHSLTVGIGLEVGQCAEQSLAPYETCCLAEIFLPNIQSKEELLKVAIYLYRINKHSLALPCHMEETEAIVHKNMRMGIGVTGYLQATEEQRSWLSEAYTNLRKYDVEYSQKMNWPTSIKITTTKPSGTLSLLAGVTAGVHPGFSKYYIRRIRIASNSSLANLCRKHGYFSEYQKNFDGTDDRNTVVVSFPVALPEGTVVAGELNAVQQLEYVKRLQTEWSDNAVSCTVYYKKDELPAIKEWLKVNYNESVKTISFCLHSDHGFVQAPHEEITKEQYEEYAVKVTPISNGEINESDMLDSFECVGGVCPIK